MDRGLFHQIAEYERDCAYEAGRLAGRLEFAGELLPALRFMLAGVGRDVDDLDDDEVYYFAELAAGDFNRLMARHLRLCEQAGRRKEWDCANRAAA